jgi:hypothetical protein
MQFHKRVKTLHLAWGHVAVNYRLPSYSDRPITPGVGETALHALHHYHPTSVMQLGHLLTRSGLTHPEVSSKVCHDSFCQLGNSVSLPWVICYEAFKGRDPGRTKIVTDNKIIEQVNSFNYLGNMISHEKELGIDDKLHNCLKITGIINNVFRPQKPLRKQEYNYTIHWPSMFCYMAVKLGLLKQGKPGE